MDVAGNGELAHHRSPLRQAQIAAQTKDMQAFMAIGRDLLVGLAAQHVDQVLGTEGMTTGPGAAVDAGQEFLCQHGAVDGLWG